MRIKGGGAYCNGRGPIMTDTNAPGVFFFWNHFRLRFFQRLGHHAGIKCTINEARTYFLGPKYAISLANLTPLPPNLELSHARSSLTSAMTFSDFGERAGARNN